MDEICGGGMLSNQRKHKHTHTLFTCTVFMSIRAIGALTVVCLLPDVSTPNVQSRDDPLHVLIAVVAASCVSHRCMPPANEAGRGVRVAVTPLAPLSPNHPRSQGKMNASSGKKPAKMARVSGISAISTKVRPF